MALQNFLLVAFADVWEVISESSRDSTSDLLLSSSSTLTWMDGSDRIIVIQGSQKGM